MPSFLRTAPARVMTGLGCWALAALAYVAAWSMTTGKPTEEYFAGPAGHWQYETGPALLLSASLIFLLLGVALVASAALMRFWKPR